MAGNVVADSPAQPEVNPDAEAAGTGPVEGGSAAKGAKSLGNVPGIAYPSIPFKDNFSWPMWAALAVNIANAAVPLLLLGKVGQGLGPPPVLLNPLSVAEHRLQVLSVFSSVSSVYVTYGTGMVTSLRVVTVYYLLTFAAVAPAIWFTGDNTLGIVFPVLFNPLWSFRCMRQPRFAILFAWVFCSTLWLLWQLLSQFNRLKAAMSHELIAGSLAPLLAAVLNSVVAPILVYAMTCLCCPGIPPFMVYLMQFVIMLVGDVMRLTSLATNSGRLLDLASNLLLGVLSDVAFRTRLMPRVIHRLRRTLAAISPLTRDFPQVIPQTPLVEIQPLMDSLLRIRFTVTYYPIITLASWSVLALVGGAPWASDPWHWIGILAHGVACLTSDSIVALAHRRWHPVPCENFLGTVSRLSAEPRAHWPPLQPTEPIPQDLWAESCVAARCGKYLTDANLTTFALMNLSCGYVYGCLWARYGLCGWIVSTRYCTAT